MLRYATVTSTSPKEATEHDGSTEAVPVLDWPDGMTLAVNDVVLVETVGRGLVVVQRMNA